MNLLKKRRLWVLELLRPNKQVPYLAFHNSIEIATAEIVWRERERDAENKSRQRERNVQNSLWLHREEWEKKMRGAVQVRETSRMEKCPRPKFAALRALKRKKTRFFGRNFCKFIKSLLLFLFFYFILILKKTYFSSVGAKTYYCMERGRERQRQTPIPLWLVVPCGSIILACIKIIISPTSFWVPNSYGSLMSLTNCL